MFELKSYVILSLSHNYRYVSVSVFNFTYTTNAYSHTLGNSGTATVNALNGKTLTVGNSYIMILQGNIYTNIITVSSNPGLTITKIVTSPIKSSEYDGDTEHIYKITPTSSSYSFNITYGSTYRGTNTTKYLWCCLLY